MSFLWPKALNPHPTAIARIGRLLHWASVIWAAGWVALAFIWNENGNADAAPIGVVIAIAIFFAGRGVRYVLAGE